MKIVKHTPPCYAQSHLSQLIWTRLCITLINWDQSHVTENPFSTLVRQVVHLGMQTSCCIFLLIFFLKNFLSLHKSWEKIKNWPSVDAFKDFEIPETG